jgi:hypothetical protein
MTRCNPIVVWCECVAATASNGDLATLRQVTALLFALPSSKAAHSPTTAAAAAAAACTQKTKKSGDWNHSWAADSAQVQRAQFFVAGIWSTLTLPRCKSLVAFIKIGFAAAWAFAQTDLHLADVYIRRIEAFMLQAVPHSSSSASSDTVQVHRHLIQFGMAQLHSAHDNLEATMHEAAERWSRVSMCTWVESTTHWETVLTLILQICEVLQRKSTAKNPTTSVRTFLMWCQKLTTSWEITNKLAFWTQLADALLHKKRPPDLEESRGLGLLVLRLCVDLLSKTPALSLTKSQMHLLQKGQQIARDAAL